MMVAGLGLPAWSEPVSYRLSFPFARNHYAEVEADFKVSGPDLEVFLPVWTPGSYMLREYSRQLESVQALGRDGKILACQKTRKNRWKVECAGQTQVTLKYRVYCREMSVRNSWVDQDYALLTGAQMFLAPVGQLKGPFRVQIQLPESWKGVETGLARTTQPNEFEAEDYDQLIDCPLLLGNPAVHEFQVGGVRHRLVNEGEGGVWDGPRSARDVQKLVQVAHQFWGDVPYGKYPPNTYTFINLLVPAGGGLEHRNSTVIMKSRWAQRVRADYQAWLALVAHEFFHAWNVKTLRPVALGPFDYENEIYTPSLWVAEGFTAYYDNLLVRRAGFSTHKEYLEALSKDVESLQGGAGRQVQPLSSSSFDAWIKFYRPDENWANSGVSYYTKGALVAFLLDARIRELTRGQHSLDDVMRLAYKKYSGATGYSEAQFRALVEEVAGASLTSFFDNYVDGLKELDFKPALAYYGLRFKPESKKDSKDPEPGWLGGTYSANQGRVVVTAVRRDTPAYRAGLNVDDEILALDEYRVTGGLEDRLKQYSPGTTVSLLVARREKVLRLPVKLEKKPSESWQIEVDPAATTESQQHRSQWLGPDLKD